MEGNINISPWGIAIIIVLLVITGIFYGFSAALQNISENDTVKRALDGEKKAVRIKRLIDQPWRYINVIPLLVTALGIICGYLLVPGLTGFLSTIADNRAAAAAVLVVAIILIASLGVLTFRRIGTYKAETFAYSTINVVHWICILLYPLTFAATYLARLVSALFGIRMNEKEASVTEEEIISIVDEAHEQGVIEENEAEMIQNIIEFNETFASDIMTHRKQIVAFDETALLSEIVDDMLEEGISRYPVYRENVDNIVGVVHYKDALKFLMQNSWAKFKPLKEIPGLIRNATFIPETRGVGDLFRLMQAQKVHMAVVVDEYGQTSGIVTLEDILEEIVGEILDEYDEEEARFRTQKDNSVLIDGLTPLDEVEDELGISFGETDFETLNGVLTSMLGHIPTAKDLDREFELDGYRFRIVSLGSKTVGKVRAQKI